MTDIVERLRSWRSRADGLMVDDCDEAVDEIERLRAKLKWVEGEREGMREGLLKANNEVYALRYGDKPG